MRQTSGWSSSLRGLRARRPPNAQRGARAQTYAAALQQAEELWAAGEGVGAASSPLLHFYGLAQAGRALCASAGITSVGGGHGLKLDVPIPPAGEPIDLTRVYVKPQGRGLIHSVAGVLSSPVLAGPASLSDLIASLHLGSVELANFSSAVLRLWGAENGSVDPYSTPANGEVMLQPIPAPRVDQTELVPASPNNLQYRRYVPPSTAAVAEWLRMYPRLSMLGEPIAVGSPSRFPGEPFFVMVGWDLGTTEDRPTQVDWVRGLLDIITSGESDYPSGVVLPTVGGNERAQHQLVTWWLVLYALSMLARYYPGPWRASLDLDASVLAVPLEELLEAVQFTVPTLLLAAFEDQLQKGQQT